MGRKEAVLLGRKNRLRMDVGHSFVLGKPVHGTIRENPDFPGGLKNSQEGRDAGADMKVGEKSAYGRFNHIETQGSVNLGLLDSRPRPTLGENPSFEQRGSNHEEKELEGA